MAKTQYFFFTLFFFITITNNFHHSQAAFLPKTTGYTCPSSSSSPSPSNQTNYPCQTYVLYTASSPNFLDLASIADLFSISRLMISKPSNISSPSSPLSPNQPLLVPISCGCNKLPNRTDSISFANLTYSIIDGDTFYLVSTYKYLNLTTYQSVMVVNPTLVPTQLLPGDTVFFPIFCKCPDQALMNKYQVKYLISYVYQISDNLPSIAAMFGSSVESIVEVNGNRTEPFETIFVPVSRIPQLVQPQVASPPPTESNNGGGSGGDNDNDSVVIGLAIGLGLCGFLLILVIGLWCCSKKGKGVVKGEDEEKQEKVLLGKIGQMESREMGLKQMEENLMADVSGCLDKYKVFKIDELRKATDGFDESCLIEGSVYKGYIDGEVFAIKKMKWNACEELKILQKVNHGNLVRLEGFCIDPEDATCYLIYEYAENGSVHWWLHQSSNNNKLSWKTRIKIAIGVANGLQYIHEHTRPRVVHKDIKTSNILLDANMRAKIANFGLAKTGCNAITMHIVGTQGYIAPEYLADGVISTKMDVFSFGVVLLELVSGKDAVDEEGRVLWASVNGILEGTEERKRGRGRD